MSRWGQVRRTNGSIARYAQPHESHAVEREPQPGADDRPRPLEIGNPVPRGKVGADPEHEHGHGHTPRAAPVAAARPDVVPRHHDDHERRQEPEHGDDDTSEGRHLRPVPRGRRGFSPVSPHCANTTRPRNAAASNRTGSSPTVPTHACRSSKATGGTTSGVAGVKATSASPAASSNGRQSAARTGPGCDSRRGGTTRRNVKRPTVSRSTRASPGTTGAGSRGRTKPDTSSGRRIVRALTVAEPVGRRPDSRRVGEPARRGSRGLRGYAAGQGRHRCPRPSRPAAACSQATRATSRALACSTSGPPSKGTRLASVIHCQGMTATDASASTHAPKQQPRRPSRQRPLFARRRDQFRRWRLAGRDCRSQRVAARQRDCYVRARTAGRFAGSFSRQRRITRSTAGSTSPESSVGGVGVDESCARRHSSNVCALNGGLPVQVS